VPKYKKTSYNTNLTEKKITAKQYHNKFHYGRWKDNIRMDLVDIGSKNGR
jgi:hypothetical protein